MEAQPKGEYFNYLKKDYMAGQKKLMTIVFKCLQ